MPKFTLAHDVRLDGKHIAANSSIDLDGSDGKQNKTLRDLLSSGRIVEEDAANNHLSEVQAKARKAEAKPPAAQPETVKK